MSRGDLISWKEECAVIHMEMDRLLTAGWPETAEERQVRRIQFMALIERRNVAAQNSLKSAGDTAKVSINQQKSSETSGVLPNAFEVEIMNVKISQEPSEAPLAIDQNPQALPVNSMFECRVMNVELSQEPSGASLAIDRGPQMPPADPMPEIETMSVEICHEPAEAALAMDRSHQAPPANPMFEARNFLKFLGLK